MPTLTIPDDTYDRITRRAAALGISVEQLVAPLLDQVAPPEPSPTDRQQAFAQLAALVDSQAHLYPPDHVLDDSRDAIYEGRLRSQA